MDQCISQAYSKDAVIIVIAVDRYSEQTEKIKECFLIALSFGIKQIIIVINKLDTVDNKLEEFTQAKETIETLIPKSDKLSIQFIATSGFHNENLTSQSALIPHTPCLLEAINNLTPRKKS